MNAKKTSLLAVTSFAVVASPLFSIISTVNAQGSNVVALNTTSALTQQRVQARCDLINSRVDTRITRFNQNKERHIERYQNIKTNVTNLITYLKGKGYDTTKLEADLAQFNSMVLEFGTDYSSFITKLEASKQYTCGSSDGQFIAKVDESRAQLTVARNQAKEIKLFIANTLRPDLKDLKNQKVN